MRQSTAELFLKLREKLGEDTAKVLTNYLEDAKEDLTSKFLTKDEAIHWFETLDEKIDIVRKEATSMFETLKAEIRANRREYIQMFETLKAEINGVRAEVKALEEKMNAKYSVLEERIKAVEAEVKALEEKMKAFQDMINEKYKRLEEKFDHKIDRTNLLLIFLIILTILGTTLFNPNFIGIIKMLLGR